MTPYIHVTSKTPRLTKPQRRLLLRLARETDHEVYPHRKSRLPARALNALGYAVSERHNGAHLLCLTKAGWDRAAEIYAAECAAFERNSLKGIAVGIGPQPEVLRPQPLADWPKGKEVHRP